LHTRTSEGNRHAQTGSEHYERKHLEEVAPMEIYTIERPSMLLAAACAPSASWLPSTARVAVLAAERAPSSQVHQVRTQAELAQVLVGTDGSYGITGFVGSNDAKPMTDGASGVPPRGRPV
jgi:hypothetical protein